MHARKFPQAYGAFLVTSVSAIPTHRASGMSEESVQMCMHNDLKESGCASLMLHLEFCCAHDRPVRM